MHGLQVSVEGDQINVWVGKFYAFGPLEQGVDGALWNVAEQKLISGVAITVVRVPADCVGEDMILHIDPDLGHAVAPILHINGPAQHHLVRSAVRQQAAGKDGVPMIGKDNRFETFDARLARNAASHWRCVPVGPLVAVSVGGRCRPLHRISCSIACELEGE